jgi:hypothetical protein
MKKPTDRPSETGKLFVGPECFGQAVDFDCGHKSAAKKHKKPQMQKLFELRRREIF